MPKLQTTLNEPSLTELLDEFNRREARKDCIFFIEHYLKTYDPRPEAYPHHLDFKLYDYQKEYVSGLVKAIREGYDVFDEKSRDMGVSWLALAVRFWMWLFDESYQGLIGSRKEEYVDDGTLKSLFPKFDYFISNIKDKSLLPKGFDIKKHRTYMKLINPVSGNSITGESSNANFSRGGRFTDVFFDELGFWPDASKSWTAAGDATRCRHAVTTPPDQPSFAKVLRFSDKILIRTWHWHLHPHKDEQWYKYEQSRRTEEEVLHELDISWEYSSGGRPYPEVNELRVGQYPYNADAPLYISIDLGLDAVAIGWYQPIVNTDWFVLVEAYEASDHVIEWYLPFFGKEFDARFDYKPADLEFIKQVRGWKEAVFFGDPSGKQRHVESGISPYSILHDHGIKVHVNEQENDWVARRDATKKLLTRLAINDTERTRWWLECMKNAHYPKREETSQSVTPISKPVHDWTSHHRTQTEYFSVNYKKPRDLSSTRQPHVSPNEMAYIDDHGRMVGAGIDIAKIMHDANRKRRRR